MYVNNSSLQLRTDRAKREEEAEKAQKVKFYIIDISLIENGREKKSLELICFVALIHVDDVTIMNDYHRKEKNIQRMCKSSRRTDRLFSSQRNISITQK